MESQTAALVKYDINEATLAVLKTKAEMMLADTPQGYEEVRKTIAVLRESRGTIEKKRVELKKDALKFERLVDSEAKRLTTLVLDIEEPLKAKKAVVDFEKDRAKREAEEAEKAKEAAAAKAIKDAEEAKLAAEREALAAERKRLEAIQAEIDANAEFLRKRIDAERRAEQERIDAERERMAAERRAEEERQRAERMRIEAEQRAEREKLEAERKAIEAERQKAEREEFERQAKLKAEKDAAEKLEREKAEAYKREAERVAMLPDVAKIKEFAAAIRFLHPPYVESKKVVGIFADAMAVLQKTAELLDASAEELAA